LGTPTSSGRMISPVDRSSSMPAWWMPASAKKSWPTIVLLRWTFRPKTVETIRLIGQGRSVLMVVVGP
jgi:hypothetical protein